MNAQTECGVVEGKRREQTRQKQGEKTERKNKVISYGNNGGHGTEKNIGR